MAISSIPAAPPPAAPPPAPPVAAEPHRVPLPPSRPSPAPPGAAGELQNLSKEELQAAQHHVQHLVEALLELQPHESILRDLWDMVDAHFRRLALLEGVASRRHDRVRSNRPAPILADQLLEQQEKFVKKSEELLTKKLTTGRLAQVAPPELLQQLLQVLRHCHAHVELLHKTLAWVVSGQSAAKEEEDSSELLYASTSKRQQEVGSEARPLQEKFVMDIQVHGSPDFRRAAGARGLQSPPADRSILLSNLPLTATEEEVRAALAPCGPLASVEFCLEWHEYRQKLRGIIPKVQAEEADSDQLKIRKVLPLSLDEAPSYTLPYAIVEFQEAAGRHRATRQAARVLGILMRELAVVSIKAKVPGSKQVGRATYPQDARIKKSLLVRGIPWHLHPSEVLQHLGQALTANDAEALVGPFTLQLANSRAFSTDSSGLDRIQHLEVEVQHQGACTVRQVPHSAFESSDFRSSFTLRKPMTNGAAVLRFSSFEDAFLARRLLMDVTLEGRQLVCGFPPWRPACCPFDSSGAPLPEPVLVDFPVPHNSAKYGSQSLDPLVASGITEEVLLSWD